MRIFKQQVKKGLWAQVCAIATAVGMSLVSVTSVSASAPVLVPGENWLGGQGVNICGRSIDEMCGDEVHVGGVGDNWWQCVELAQRLYSAHGWHSGIFAGVGVATDIYTNAAASGFTRQPNGGVSAVVPGDMLVFSGGGGAGHVGVIDTIVDNGDGSKTLTVINQNAYEVSSNVTWNPANGMIGVYDYMNGSSLDTSFAVMGVVHTDANTNSVSIAEGSYIKTATSDAVYVIAGGMAVAVPSWGSVNGEKSTAIVSQAQLDERLVPVQDGTYFGEYGNPNVYVVVGGAALLVPDWGTVGGPKGAAMLPAGSIEANFSDYPADGTYVAEYGEPQVRVVAGGATLGVSNWGAVGGPKPVTVIPAGSIGAQLLVQPREGTYVRGFTTNKVYRMQDDRATYVPAWGSEPPQPFVDVDQAAISGELHAVEDQGKT